MARSIRRKAHLQIVKQHSRLGRPLQFEQLEQRQVLNGLALPLASSVSADPATTHLVSSLATEAPRVEGVYVRGTAWKEAFTNGLAASGLGSASLGYKVSNGANQLKPLPWTSINQISVVFDQDVVVSADDAQLFGVSVPNYTTSFAYNTGTHTATWTLSTPIAADKMLLQLNGTSGGITSAATGMLLDGEWADASSTQSGDGTAGGNFGFRVNVLPGDVDQNGSVNIFDLLLVRNTQGTLSGTDSYLYYRDTDGSGSTAIFDLLAVRNQQSAVVPAGNIFLARSASDLVQTVNVIAIAGDTIIVPPGTYDVRSLATLSPKPGVSIRGAGLGVTTIWGKWFSSLGSATAAVNLEQMSLNTTGLSDTYFAIRFDGGVVNFSHVEMYGPPSNTTICGFTAYSGPGTWNLKNCVFHDVADGYDLVVTLGANGAPNSLKSSLTVENCEGYHNGRGTSDQFVSGHGDVACYVVGGTYHDPLGVSAFAPGSGTTNGYTRMELRDVTILSSATIGAGTDNVALVDGCYIEGPRVSCSYLIGAVRGSIITNNHLVTTASFGWGAIYCGSAATGGATITIANNWVEKRASGNAFYCYTAAGLYTNTTINYFNNRVSGNYADEGFTVDRGGSPTILFRNNVVDVGTTYAIRLNGSGGTIAGDHNILPGAVLGYTLDATDINAAPMLDANGTPTLGGNCDGTGNTEGVTILWDLLGNPRTRSGTICRGPIERLT